MKTRHPDARLLIFARPPVPGRCKSRLAASLGKRGAADACRRILESLVTRMTDSGIAPVELWASDNPGHPALLRLRSQHPLSLHRQRPGTLGERMRHAFVDAAKRGRRVVIIGSDCAALMPEHIDAALSAVDKADAAIQPAEDGGYVLIAARETPSPLLRGVEWGSSKVMRQTRTRAARYGMALAELPTLWDIDDLADWQRARREGLV